MDARRFDDRIESAVDRIGELLKRDSTSRRSGDRVFERHRRARRDCRGSIDDRDIDESEPRGNLQVASR